MPKQFIKRLFFKLLNISDLHDRHVFNPAKSASLLLKRQTNYQTNYLLKIIYLYNSIFYHKFNTGIYLAWTVLE